jgi:predicted SAM-dependent methyltransferase
VPLHGSIFAIPACPDAYDGIYNLGVMEHFTEEEIKRILDEFHRVLKPDGKIILFWPPVFGLSMRFLAALRWLLSKTLRREIKLHPDELTHIRSSRQARQYLERSGFCLEEFYFGMRDMFTHAVIVGRKTALSAEGPDEVSSISHAKSRAR